MATRAELVERVTALREQGLYNREIGERLGISASYVSEIRLDPTGEKAKERKRGYSGTCHLCGGPTTGSLGRSKAPTTCRSCLQGPPHWARNGGPPDRRRRVPVRLIDVSLDKRMAGAEEACKYEDDGEMRNPIVAAAIWPSDTTYWIAA